LAEVKQTEKITIENNEPENNNVPENEENKVSQTKAKDNGKPNDEDACQSKKTLIQQESGAASTVKDNEMSDNKDYD
jgi:hypothetical protein